MSEVLNVQAGVDASQAISGLAAMQAAMAGVGVGIQDASLRMVEWNRRGDEMKTRIEGLTDAGKKFQAVLVQNEKSKWAPTAQSFRVVEPRPGKPAPVEDENPITQALKDLTSPHKEVTAGGLIDKIANIGQLQLIKQTFNAIFTSIKQGVQDAIQFELKISEIRTIAQDSSLTFRDWRNTISDLSNKFGVDQLDVAGAAYQALSNQVARTAQITPFMTTALEFAKVTATSATDSVNLLSSALNSYNMKADQAERVSGILFKTIELGRITGPEVANSIGRVTQMGSTLGVTLEEISAGMVALTTAGIKPNEAMTLLTNVMQKLLRPSEQMKKLLESWGTPTAEAAVATFGFAGTLRKIEEAARGSVTEISNLFNEIRAGRGVQGLTLFGGFEDALSKIKSTSADTYEVAKKLVDESPGRQMIIEWNKVKNFFVNDFGSSVLASVSKFNKEFVSLSDVVTKGTKLMLMLAEAWISIKGVVILATTAQKAWTIAIEASAAAQATWNAATAAGVAHNDKLGLVLETVKTQGALTADLLITKYGALAAKFAAAAAAYVGLKYVMSSSKLEDAIAGGAFKDIQETKAKQQIKATVDTAQKQTDAFKTNVDQIYQVLLNKAAGATQSVTNYLIRLRTEAADFSNKFTNAFDLGLNRLKDKLKETTDIIGRAKRGIIDSERGIADFNEKAEEQVFRRRLNYATDFQAQQLLNNRMEEIKNSINALYGEALDEKLDFTSREASRRKAQQQLENLRQLAEEQEEVRKKLLTSYYGGQNVGIMGPSQEYLNNIATATQLNIGLEKQWQAALNKTAKSYEELANKQKAQIDLAQKNAKDLFDFRKQIESGTVFDNKKFQTATGQADTAKVMAEYERLQKNLLAVTQGDPKTAAQFLEFHQKMEEDKTKITQLAAGERANIELKLTQENLIKQRDAVKRAYEEATTAQKDAATTIYGEEGIKKLAQDLKDASAIFNTNIVEMFGVDFAKWSTMLRAIPGIDSQNVAKEMMIRNEDLQRIEVAFKMIAEMQNKKFDFTNVLDVQKFNEMAAIISKTITRVQIDLQRFADLQAGGKADLKKIFVPGKEGKDGIPGVSYQDVINNLREQFAKLSDVVDKSKEATAKKEELDARLQNTINTLPPQMAAVLENLRIGSETASTSITNDFTRMTDTVIGTGRAIDDLKARLDKLMTIGAINIPINIQQNGNPNIQVVPDPNANPKGFAFGGPVYGPRGSDNIPAWLTKGEFVMNAEATKAFYAQLVSMNNSVRPGYYSRGGYVTTNVGDIHMNVTSTGNPEKDVRGIANRLRRELKRGTIRLY